MSDSKTPPRPAASPGTGAAAGAPRDRRASHRAAIEIPAVLHVGTREIGCSIRDLSTQGIAVALRESLAPGMVVRLAFRLPNARQPLEVAGVLVRTATEGGRRTVGLEFVEPNVDALRAIATFVDRNRSDSPFSHRRRRPDTVRVVTDESTSALPGLYKRAVEAEGAKREKRGLLSRWLGRSRDKSS